MNIISLIKFITNHPLNKENKIKAILRLFKWQINSRINPYPIVYAWTDKAKLIVQKGMTGATGNLYCGLHEYYDMAFLLHFLREDDIFVDIGANVGSYTVLASAHVGAKSISFEPVPATFKFLRNNVLINNVVDKVLTYNIALGSSQGFVEFTSSLDTVNHVVKDKGVNTIKVPVDLLDNVIKLDLIPSLIKMDVEGFETEVIKGALSTLKQKGLKAIIIELNGSGARYGYDEKMIHETLVNLAFKPCQYLPEKRAVVPINNHGSYNTIYIRDMDFVINRLKGAKKIKIFDSEI